MNKATDLMRFAAALAKLFAGRQREPSDLELEAYYETLEKFDIDLVERVMKKIREKPGSWAASEGDIHEACLNAKPSLVPKADLKAIEGYKRDPSWDDPRVQAEARDMISRIKAGPMQTWATALSGLPEAEKAAAKVKNALGRRR